MQPKSDQQCEIEKLAKKYRDMDGRLSWETCLSKAKRSFKHFGSPAFISSNSGHKDNE
ncbi:hypothetical protein [Vibrio owensii]|uniref:hypothetical protein n=1 Tax=Vibrio harveyi group TaxID=717610 RepID=UPI003CC56A9E